MCPEAAIRKRSCGSPGSGEGKPRVVAEAGTSQPQGRQNPGLKAKQERTSQRGVTDAATLTITSQADEEGRKTLAIRLTLLGSADCTPSDQARTGHRLGHDPSGASHRGQVQRHRLMDDGG